MNIVLLQKNEVDAGVLPLADVRSRHIIDVLSKGPGDSFDAGIMDGAAGVAHITATDGSLRFTFEAKSDGKPLYPLEMIVGFPRPIQLKRLFRDMASLGVRALHLCGTDLGEKSYLDSKIVERGSARRLLEEGTAQAKSTHVPRLTIDATLDTCLQAQACRGDTPPFARARVPPLRIAADNVAPTIPLMRFLTERARFLQERASGGATPLRIAAGHGVPAIPLAPAQSVPFLCAIGAERGWTDRERELLLAHGFTLCSMGTRVLRTETACTVAASLILGAMGVLG